jgi:membrane protein
MSSSIMDLFKETFSDWSEDNAPRLAAALAYYTVFAIAPLLVIAIAIAGLFLDRAAATDQISQQVSGVLGSTAGDAVNGMVQQASSRQGTGIVATIIGIATLLFGASGVFGELQNALNTVWEVAPKPNQGLLATIKQRFFSFGMVLDVALENHQLRDLVWCHDGVVCPDFQGAP